VKVWDESFSQCHRVNKQEQPRWARIRRHGWAKATRLVGAAVLMLSLASWATGGRATRNGEVSQSPVAVV
jgi:hypothetical protein